MTTSTFGNRSLSNPPVGLGAKLDDMLGNLLSVKPSVIADCFSAAMTASHALGADELSRVSAQRVRGARQAMGLSNASQAADGK